MATSAARIRSGPGLQSSILGHLPTGTRVIAEAVSGPWVKITFNGVSGWVHSSLLQ